MKMTATPRNKAMKSEERTKRKVKQIGNSKQRRRQEKKEAKATGKKAKMKGKRKRKEEQTKRG
jgi:hypothetical protein